MSSSVLPCFIHNWISLYCFNSCRSCSKYWENVGNIPRPFKFQFNCFSYCNNYIGNFSFDNHVHEMHLSFDQVFFFFCSNQNLGDPVCLLFFESIDRQNFGTNPEEQTFSVSLLLSGFLAHSSKIFCLVGFVDGNLFP